jgi:hypothetical protein
MNLKEQTSRVVAEAEEAEQLREQRLSAEAQVLDNVLQIVGPALQAIGSRVVVQRTKKDYHKGKNYHEDRTPFRAVCLTGQKPGPARERTHPTGGRYKGHDLFVDSKGTLFEIEYFGSYEDQGHDSWFGAYKPYSTVRQAVEHWEEVASYIEHLLMALNQTRTGYIERQRCRIDKAYQALAVLRADQERRHA